MAGSEPSTTRRCVLGAVAALPIAALMPTPSVATPSGRTLWDRRLARYRRAEARAKHAAETGWFRVANDRHARDIEALLARFGSWAKAQGSPDGAAQCDAIWQRLDEAEDAYWDRCTLPMEKAAVALALTPALDADALIVKLRVMLNQKLEQSDAMPQHPFEVLEEDLGRLSAAGDRQIKRSS